jgi:hypothetical protein
VATKLVYRNWFLFEVSPSIWYSIIKIYPKSSLRFCPWLVAYSIFNAHSSFKKCRIETAPPEPWWCFLILLLSYSFPAYRLKKSQVSLLLFLF